MKKMGEGRSDRPSRQNDKRWIALTTECLRKRRQADRMTLENPLRANY